MHEPKELFNILKNYYSIKVKERLFYSCTKFYIYNNFYFYERRKVPKKSKEKELLVMFKNIYKDLTISLEDVELISCFYQFFIKILDLNQLKKIECLLPYCSDRINYIFYKYFLKTKRFNFNCVNEENEFSGENLPNQNFKI